MGLRILLVDDSPDDVLIMHLGFEEAGVDARIESLYSGEQLIRRLEQEYCGPALENGEATPLPDVLLLDLKMPKMDGFEVLRWLRQHPPLDRLQVIVFSGSDQPVDINRALALGAVRYLVKPQKLSDMIQMVRSIEKFGLKLRSERGEKAQVASQ